MADIALLEKALINADKAGDAQGARILAAEIQRMRAQPEAPKAVSSGKLLPISRFSDGSVGFDSNAGIVGQAKRAFNLPGEVMRGEIDPKSDEGIGRAMEMGMMATPVTPSMRAAGIPGVVPMRQTVPKPPTADALKEAASTGYDKARDMGVEYSSDAVKRIAEALTGSLEKDGILGELAPKAFGILGKLAKPPEGSTAPLAGIEAARRGLGNAAKDFANPTEQLAARRIMEGLEGFVSNPPEGAVLAGPATAASKLLEEARGNYGAAMRSGKVTGAEEAAELGAAAANSGANLGNAIRQRVKPLVGNAKQNAGFSSAETEALREIVDGTRAQNYTRYIGNLLGGGGGLGAAVTGGLGAAGGFAAGGPIGAGVGGMVGPIVGAAAKAGSNALTSRALSLADELVRSRSPLYEQMKAAAPMEARSPEGVAAIVRALMGTSTAR